MLEFGTIVETKVENNKALAKVNILGRVTDWLPILGSANSFKRSFSPARVKEQVAVLDDLLILGSIFYQGCSEPAGNDKKEITEFEDGTTISYDTSSSTLEVLNPKDINILCSNSANITAKDINIEASASTTIKSPITKILSSTILLQGAITTAGKDGAVGTFKLKGALDISQALVTGGDASIGGIIKDARGDLTNHTNDGHGRD